MIEKRGQLYISVKGLTEKGPGSGVTLAITDDGTDCIDDVLLNGRTRSRVPRDLECGGGDGNLRN